MLKKICDRCGKIIGQEKFPNNVSTKHMGVLSLSHGLYEKQTYDLGAVKSPSNSLVHYVFRGKPSSYELCDECVASFKNWMVEVFAFDKMMSELEKGRSLENESRKEKKTRNNEETS